MSGFMSLSNLVNIIVAVSVKEQRAVCALDAAIFVKNNAIDTVAKEGR